LARNNKTGRNCSGSASAPPSTAFRGYPSLASPNRPMLSTLSSAACIRSRLCHLSGVGSGAYSAKLFAGTRQRFSGFSQPRPVRRGRVADVGDRRPACARRRRHAQTHHDQFGLVAAFGVATRREPGSQEKRRASARGCRHSGSRGGTAR
jgi:hypothetical protein